MKTRMTLTPPVALQITQDWAREFPGLGIYKPRWLLRRAGPLLVGICLDKGQGGDVYMPCFHVHFLGREFPCVSLTLLTHLCSERSGGARGISARWHDRMYRAASADLARQAPLPLKGDLPLRQVLRAYRDYAATPLGQLEPVLLYRDAILLTAWAGRTNQACWFLRACLWQGFDEARFRHVGGREAFETDCRRLIVQPGLIHQTVQAQIARHDLERLPAANLIR